MLIIKVEAGNIERALKLFKRKVNKTKQTHKLRNEKQYTKPSAKKRFKNQKAKYIQRLNDSDQES